MIPRVTFQGYSHSNFQQSVTNASNKMFGIEYFYVNMYVYVSICVFWINDVLLKEQSKKSRRKQKKNQYEWITNDIK